MRCGRWEHQQAHDRFGFLQDAPDLGAAASVLNEDYRPGGRVYLAANDPVTVADLLHASLVGSDNTATMSLVRISRMSEVDFVSQMNTRAAELGMMATVFTIRPDFHLVTFPRPATSFVCSGKSKPRPTLLRRSFFLKYYHSRKWPSGDDSVDR